jgi:mannose-6-phosphate isomerase
MDVRDQVDVGNGEQRVMSYGRVLGGALQDYAWGRPDGLSPWTGLRTGGPEAELWFGTHAAAPSPTLRAIPEGAPGAADAPLLVKILAAAKPLSIQVHPSHAAMARMRQDGHAGLLADGGEKAELLVAVERFEALAGLRPAREARDVVRAMGLDDAADLLDRGDVPGAIAALLSTDLVPDYDAALAVLPPVERVIVTKAIEAFPGDPGVPVVFVMQPHVLQPGDALCVPVGVAHAYVDGLAVEVMTSCDNVLRLGLTSKVVAVEAALLALDAGRGPQCVRAAEAAGSYDSAVMPFVVDRLDHASSPIAAGAIALALEGDLTVASPFGTLEARAGQAVYVEQDGPWSVTARGVAFVATPRVPDPCHA